MNLIKILFNAAKKTSEQVGNMLEAAMVKAARDVIEDEITGYSSDFKKMFKEKLHESLSAGFDGMTLTDYVPHIIDAVRAKHEEVLKDVDFSGIEATIRDVTAPIKKHYKLSELVELYKDSIDDYEKEDLDECYLHVATNCGSSRDMFKITFGKDESNPEREVKVIGRMKEKNCFLLETDTHFSKYEKGKPATIEAFSRFQMLMLKICNSTETTIELDEKFVDCEYYKEY